MKIICFPGHIISYFMLFLMLMVSFSSHGENDTVNFTKEIRFRAHSTGQAEYTNDILQKISQASDKMRVYTSYNIKTSLEYSVESLNNNNKRIVIYLNKPEISGDYRYKDFTLYSHLLPDIYTAKIQLENNNKSVNISKTLKINQTNDFPAVIIDTVLLSTQTDYGVSFKIRSFDCSYSEKKYNDFLNFTTDLEEYYKASEALTNAMSTIWGMHLEKPANLVLDEFKLCDIESLLGEISISNFLTNKHIRRNDVNSLFVKYHIIKEDAIGLRIQFNNKISSLDYLFYEEAEIELRKGNISDAENLYKKVLNYNRFHVPALVGLGKIDIIKKNYDDALDRAYLILIEIYPSGEWLDLVIEYSWLVYKEILQKIDGLIEDQNYTEALKEVEKLHEFCNLDGPFRCDRQVFMKERKARVGIFNSYISVANRAFASDNLSFSEMYTISALEYLEEHENIIGDYDTAEKLLESILNSYLENSFKNLNEGEFDKAVYFLENTDRLCNSYDFLYCPDNILNELEFARKAMESALIAEFDGAEQDSLKADKIIHHTKNEIRDDILEKLSHGHLMAWAGKVNEAKKSLKEAINESDKYSFNRDTLVHSRILNLRERIFKKECELTDRYLKNNLDHIESLINYNEYGIANDSLKKLKKVIAEYKGCDFNYKDTIAYFEQFKHAANYQDAKQSAMDALRLYSNPKLEVFFERYTEAQAIYFKYKLGKLSLEHEKLIDYILESSGIDMLKDGIKYFSDIGEVKKTIVLLNDLKNRGVSSREAKDLQEYAGKKASEKYRTLIKNRKPKNVAKSITNNDRWFKHFVKAFRKNW